MKNLEKEENSATNSEVETSKEDSETKPTTSKEESNTKPTTSTEVSKPQLEDVSKKRKKESSTSQVKKLKKETDLHPYHYWMA